MGKANFRVRRDFDRPDPALVARFRDVPIANIDDAMGRMASMSSKIKPYGLPRMVGPAFTIKMPYGDNLLLHQSISLVKPGDVVVIQSGGSADRAIFGGLLVREMRNLGLAGVVVDGAIRDAEEIADLGFPVYAAATSPNGPYKNGPGEVNFPVAVGGQAVCPGDIICGDGDGVIVIPRDAADQVAQDMAQVVAKEAMMLEQVNAGQLLDRGWVAPKLEELGITIE